MKNAFLLIALFICLRPAFPFLEYAANYDYISRVLCINKDKPQLQCYGKCYLMKAVKEVEDDRQDKPALKFEHQILFYQQTEEAPEAISFTAVQYTNPLYAPEYYTSPQGGSPLKPPISLR